MSQIRLYSMEQICIDTGQSASSVRGRFDVFGMGSPRLELLRRCRHETCDSPDLRYNVKSGCLEHPRGDLILKTEEYEPFKGSDGLLYIMSMGEPAVLIFAWEAEVRAFLDWLNWLENPVAF